MENETSAQSELRHVADEILAKPLPPLAATMRRLVGSEADFGKIVSAGWKILHANTDRGSIGEWKHSAWFEKEIVRDGTIWLFHLASCEPFTPAGADGGKRAGVPNGEPLAGVLRGTRPASVFLRDLQVVERKEGRLDADEASGSVPQPVLLEIESDLTAALIRPAPAFLDDFRFQTMYAEMPATHLSPDAEFDIRLKKLAEIVGRQSDQGTGASVFRLLLPLVDALKSPVDAETETLLGRVSDLRLVRRFFDAARCCRPLHPEIGDAIGAWALSIMAEIPEHSLESDDWRFAFAICFDAGFPLAAVLAVDRDLASRPGSDDTDAGRALAKAVQAYFRSIPANGDDPPRGLPDVIGAMMRQEDALVRAPIWPKGGYWLLLALAMRLNGITPEGVRSTLDHGLVESGFNESHHRALDFPLAWQTETIVLGDPGVWYVRRQLRAFPTPLMDSDERGPWIVPARTTKFLGVELFFRGVVENASDKFLGLLGNAEKNGVPWRLSPNRIDGDPDDPEVWKLHALQEPDTSPDVWFRESRWYEPGKEIGWVVTKGSPTREGPYRPRGFCPIVERGSERTTLVTTWRWFPYEDNAGGEALIRLSDGRPLRAVVSMFAGDRQTVERGYPRPCQLCGFGSFVRRRTGDPAKDVPEGFLSHGFVETTARYMLPINPDTCAGYWFSGRVRSVAPAGVAGCDDIVRLTVDASLPFPLPIYAPPAELPGELREGDEICGFATLVVDYYGATPEIAAEMRRTHPDGPGPEPRYELSIFTGLPKPPIEVVSKKDPRRPGRYRRPSEYDILGLAERWLVSVYGPENVGSWPVSPRCVSFVIRRDGREEARTVVVLTGSETPVSYENLPVGPPILVMRFLDDGDKWRIRYEEHPAKTASDAS